MSEALPRRILLYLYGTPNLVGSLLGLLGLALHFAGVIDRYWLLIVIGLYALGVVATPRRRAESLNLQRELSEEELRKALERLIRRVRRRLSPPVVERLDSIKENLLALLPRLKEMDGASEQLHIVRRTATDYLPEMLERYLRLPPAFARLHAVKDDKTPRDLLIGQLDLMDDQLKKILTDVYRDDTNALMAHGRFLEKKFADGGNWLE